MNKIVEERTKRTQWYREARFGMFIHWGLYAIPARGEWLRSVEQLTKEAYEPLKDEFAAENYNPKEWAKLAKEAGMKYAVLTAKHHDGYCLFDSKLTDFKSTNSPCGRDLVREFLEAFRAEGIRVGLYYSVIDWRHPDFPHYGDMHHPMRNHPECSNENRNFDNYLEYMFGQIKELLTDYGKLDVMWFDFSYGNMKCDTWKARELIEMVRSIQPDVIIDNRLEGSGEDAGSIRTLDPTPYSGDFASPEQMIPPEGIRDVAGNPIPWEACITLNNHWGYAAHDHHYKSAEMVVHMLVECVSKGGNLLLNVGPDPEGRFPREAVETLDGLGKWMEENGEAVYGTRGGIWQPKDHVYGSTCKGDNIYVHILDGEAFRGMSLPGTDREIKSAELMDGRAVEFTQDPGRVTLRIPEDVVRERRIDTVVRLRTERGTAGRD